MPLCGISGSTLTAIWEMRCGQDEILKSPDRFQRMRFLGWLWDEILRGNMPDWDCWIQLIFHEMSWILNMNPSWISGSTLIENTGPKMLYMLIYACINSRMSIWGCLDLYFWCLDLYFGCLTYWKQLEPNQGTHWKQLEPRFDALCFTSVRCLFCTILKHVGLVYLDTRAVLGPLSPATGSSGTVVPVESVGYLFEPADHPEGAFLNLWVIRMVSNCGVNAELASIC